jgi:hypothetical protein
MPESAARLVMLRNAGASDTLEPLLPESNDAMTTPPKPTRVELL